MMPPRCDPWTAGIWTLFGLVFMRVVYKKCMKPMLQSTKESTPMPLPLGLREEWVELHEAGTTHQIHSIVYQDHPLARATRFSTESAPTVTPEKKQPEEEQPVDVATELLVLFIPGNPGATGFYAPFLHQLVGKFLLHQQQQSTPQNEPIDANFLRCKVEIRCLAHSGHYSDGALPDKHHCFELQDQIDHKAQFLKTKLAQNPNLRIILVGHSVGAFVAVSLLHQFHDHVVKLALLQPMVLHMGKTPRGKSMRWLVENHTLAASVVHWIDLLLPTKLRAMVLRFGMQNVHQDPMLRHSVLALVNRQVVLNAMFMAFQEMHQVQQLPDQVEQVMHKFQKQTLFVFSEQDGWVPPEFRDHLQQVFDHAKHQVVTVPHAFMMSLNGSDEIADLVWKWIEKDMQ